LVVTLKPASRPSPAKQRTLVYWVPGAWGKTHDRGYRLVQRSCGRPITNRSAMFSSAA